MIVNRGNVVGFSERTSVGDNPVFRKLDPLALGR
jgi:hypothetical protein